MVEEAGGGRSRLVEFEQRAVVQFGGAGTPWGNTALRGDTRVAISRGMLPS